MIVTPSLTNAPTIDSKQYKTLAITRVFQFRSIVSYIVLYVSFLYFRVLFSI